MTEDHMRALARLLAYTAALSLVGVSIAMNVQAGLAKSEFLSGQITWAAASVASDVLKAVSPLLIVWAIARRDVAPAIAGAFVLSVTAGYSLTSALSYSHGSVADANSNRAAQRGEYERASREYESTEAALRELAPSRSVAEIDAKIAALLVDPLADDCREINGPVTQRVCPRVAELRAERAIAEEKAKLQTELRSAQAKLDALPSPKVADPATDAVISVWRLIGEPPAAETVSLWLSLSGVLLVEVGSMFGLLLASGMDVGSTKPAAAPSAAGDVPRNEDGAHEPPADTKPEQDRENLDDRVEAREVETQPTVSAQKRKRGRPARETGTSLEKLKAIARNGKVSATHSALANVLGVSKTTAQRQLRSLEKSGAVRLTAGRRGTLIRLM